MCGIAGIICSNPVSQESISTILEKMLKSIIHRGPDEVGMGFTPYGGMGTRRLSIIDIRNGQQPFHHPDKPYILAYNGEIYNYRALRQKLESKGVVFQTHSDTEVLMMMYDYYDEDMFQYLEGMYAFALWNGLKNELIIARDPLGKKPLYYEMDDYGIAFASELKAILQARNTKPLINEVAIQNYLALQYIPSPMTMYQGIFKLPPGYMLRWRIEDKSLEVWPTWIPDDEVSRHVLQNKNLSMDKALDEFDRQLQRAVELRVKAADVPVGVFLSGGLDSSLITALAKQHTDYPLHTYSVGHTYSKPADDERQFARQVAEALGSKHHEIEIGPEVLDQLPRILWHLDEPIADPALVSTDALSQAAGSGNLKVVLTGQGADEIFGGYRKYASYQQLVQISQTPAVLRKMLGLLGVWHLAFLALGWNRAQLVHAMLNNTDPLAIWQTYRNFPENERKRLLKPGEWFPDKRFRVFSKGAFDPYVQLQWDDLHHWLPHDLLLGLDKVTMAHSLEARAPFLDHHLATWAIGLPERLKWQKNTNKFLLREYAKRHLPQNIVKRPKKGFDLPMDDWLYPRLATLRPKLLESALFQETGMFSQDYVTQLLRWYESGVLKTAQPVWNLLVLKVWYDVFTQCETEDDIWELQTAGKSVI
jgi:asparagine synthase (glutamine-hydrolysing)